MGARPRWVANDPFLAKDAGMRPGQQYVEEFLSRSLSRYGGAWEDGLKGLFAGIYRMLATCHACKMATSTDQASGTLRAPLIYKAPTDFCDIGQILSAAYADVSLIRKR